MKENPDENNFNNSLNTIHSFNNNNFTLNNRLRKKSVNMNTLNHLTIQSIS